MLNSIIGDELMSGLNMFGGGTTKKLALNVRLDTRGITVMTLVCKRTFKEFWTKLHILHILLVNLSTISLTQIIEC